MPVALSRRSSHDASERSDAFVLGGRFAFLDVVLLLAIAACVVMVSLPRLGSFARSSNEQDARNALALLGSVVFAGEPSISQLEVAFGEDVVKHRLRDARLLTNGAAYHGYTFALGVVAGEPAIVAWPRIFGHTGRRAFARSASGTSWVHANESGRWTGGLVDPGRVRAADEGWLRVESPQVAGVLP